MATCGGTEAVSGVAENGGTEFEAAGGWSGVLTRLLAGENLDTTESEAVLDQVLAGDATPAQLAAFLVALRAKGATVDEVAGLARAMVARAERLDLGASAAEAIDVVGTGGDRLRSINVSTIAALVSAGAGAKVCKHGNRAASSSVGTADVLEALGVAIELGPKGVTACVDEAGMGFCFAQRYHPAMRYVGPVRKELGVPTVFNYLGPLAHPAQVARQLVGVSQPELAPIMARVLGTNGSRRAMVVFGDDGLDELSVTSPSTVTEVIGDGRDYEVKTWRIEPGELGLVQAKMDELRGGDAAFNADVIRRVLDGEHSARRDIGVLNAGAALVVAGIVADLPEGIEAARVSIDSGRAAEVLDALVRVSTREAAAEA
jgi:anthranilate phosphoribosyltransferase